MQLTAEGCDGGTGELDSEIFDAMTELTAGLTAVTGQVARHRGLPERAGRPCQNPAQVLTWL
jgi:hypothetical protein